MPGDALTIVSAAAVSLEACAVAFTAAFQGYFHPVSHDAATLAQRVRLEQYDLENSLLALDRVPGALRVVNEPERSPFAAALPRHGFAEVIRQYEMSVEL